MTIGRYLVREMTRPLAAILGILVALFASYTAAGFLSNAVDGLLPPGMIAQLIGLKLLVSLEVLIPASLYVSVLLCFARLRAGSEVAAMFAIRMTPATPVRAVLALSLCLALGVAVLSLVVRPFAYQRLHVLSDRAATLLDLDAMEAGSFYVGQQGDRVIFLGHRDAPGAPARDVFIRLRHADRTELVHARLADRMLRQTLRHGDSVYLTDAHIYELARSRGRPDQVVDAQGLVIDPDARHGAAPAYSAVAASTLRLLGSRTPEDTAELQWRLSTPLSTLLLGLLGLPLAGAGAGIGQTRPRQARTARLGIAMLAYFAYYLLCTSARTWVQHGAVGRFPGIWWAPALLGLFVVVASVGPRLGAAGRPGRA